MHAVCRRAAADQTLELKLCKQQHQFVTADRTIRVCQGLGEG